MSLKQRSKPGSTPPAFKSHKIAPLEHATSKTSISSVKSTPSTTPVQQKTPVQDTHRCRGCSGCHTPGSLFGAAMTAVPVVASCCQCKTPTHRLLLETMSPVVSIPSPRTPNRIRMGVKQLRRRESSPFVTIKQMNWKNVLSNDNYNV